MQAMQRTVNPHATFGPAEQPGVSWHEYFIDLKRRHRARKGLDGFHLEVDEDGMEIVVEDGDQEPAFVVTEPGRPMLDDEWPRTMKSLRTRLSAQDWEVSGRISKTHHEPKLFVGTTANHDRGDVRTPEHDQVHFALLGVRYNEDGDMAVIAFEASWDQRLIGSSQSPAFDGATTQDPILGREWRTRYLSPKKPDKWEPGQRVLAQPFTVWLDIVAPQPGKPKKKSVTEADMLNGGEWNG